MDSQAVATGAEAAMGAEAAAEGSGALADTGPETGSPGSPPHEAGADSALVDAAEGGGPTQGPPDTGSAEASTEAGGCGVCPVDTPTCVAGQCTVRGPTMVEASGFYIDSTEVTVAQYQLFLAAKGTDMSGQPPVCSWNKTYYDTSVAMNPGTWPITNVDWCDALAYCTWAGKHLCGAVGGGAVASTDALTASKSQWYLACGGPGGGTHPNGDATCNSNGDNLAPVATFPTCDGYYTKLYDMEGNAAEWVDSCDGTAGAADMCLLLGGSYLDEQSYCTESLAQQRNEAADPFGFRCCGG
jgi:sulfatase modifying factor 1